MTNAQTKRASEVEHLRKEIRRVYVEQWDPLRLMDDPTWPRDEYDRYIDGAVSLSISSASDSALLDHLEWAVGCMGMDGSGMSLQQVVDALRKIDLRGN
jgi:hypothetical protein